MGAWSRFTRTLFGGSHREDIREELEFHIAMDMQDGRERRDAHWRLGNTTRIAEDTRPSHARAQGEEPLVDGVGSRASRMCGLLTICRFRGLPR